MKKSFLLILFLLPLFAHSQEHNEADSIMGRMKYERTDSGRLKLLLSASTACRKTGEYPKALDYAQQALQLAQTIKDFKDQSLTLNILGKVYADKGDYPKALEYHLNALKIAEQNNDRATQAATLNNIGIVYDGQGNAQLALGFFNQALKLNESIKDTDGADEPLNNIGLVYLKQGDNDKALNYFLQSLRQGEQKGDKNIIALNLRNIGLVYDEAGNDSMALVYYQKSFRIAEEIADRNLLSRLLMNIGHLYAGTGKYADAIDYLKNARDLSDEIGAVERARTSWRLLSDVYEKIANSALPVDRAEYYNKALTCFKIYAFMTQNIFSANNSEKIARLALQYEEEKKEKERITARNWAIAGIGLLIAVTAVTIIYYYRKRKTDKIIADEKTSLMLKNHELQSITRMLEVQEKERKRIAGDLHDKLGSSLSAIKLYFAAIADQPGQLDEKSRERFDKATLLLDQASRDVRQISHSLASGDLLSFGLVPVLGQLAQTITDSGKIRINLYTYGFEDRPGSSVEIELYGIVLELVNNAIKHSEASLVDIQLNRMGSVINLIVEDNGKGFDIAAVKENGGMGLKNMESRVLKLKGAITVESVKGRGTTTNIDIPV